MVEDRVHWATFLGVERLPNRHQTMPQLLLAKDQLLMLGVPPSPLLQLNQQMLLSRYLQVSIVTLQTTTTGQMARTVATSSRYDSSQDSFDIFLV